MLPSRISFVTYNLWLTERWPERAAALERFLTLFAPDVLCVQELQRATQEFIDGVLREHERIRDPFSGWTNESNIYWRRAVFERIDHGAEEVGHLEAERRLFWVRLVLKTLKKTIFVATAHLTPPRRGEEPETGVSPRVGQLRRIAGELGRLVREGDPGGEPQPRDQAEEHRGHDPSSPHHCVRVSVAAKDRSGSIVRGTPCRVPNIVRTKLGSSAGADRRARSAPERPDACHAVRGIVLMRAGPGSRSLGAHGDTPPRGGGGCAEKIVRPQTARPSLRRPRGGVGGGAGS